MLAAADNIEMMKKYHYSASELASHSGKSSFDKQPSICGQAQEFFMLAFAGTSMMPVTLHLYRRYPP